MSHYFKDDPNLKSNIRTIKFSLFEKEYTFYTDDGIFSKDHLDYGTKVLLKTLIREPLDGKCLDLGCANGIVGIVLKTMFADLIFDLIDINNRAIEVAKKNIELYGLDDLEAFYSDGFENVKGNYNFIFFNPPIRAGKKQIYSLYEEAFNFLENSGYLYIVIRKDKGALSSKAKLMEVFGNCTIIEKDKGFYVLKSKKEE